MFEVSTQLYPAFAESTEEACENNRAFNIYHASPQMADGSNQKIFLPREPGQSRFAPPSYYYLASKTGATPSWVIDELHRARSLNLNS